MKGEVVRALDCESVWSCPNILERIFLLTVWTGLNGHQSQSRFSLRSLQGGQLCEHAFLLLHVIFQHNDFDRLHELCAIYYMPIWLESPAYTWDSRSISSDHGSTSSRFIPRPVRTWSINFASVLKQWMKANGCGVFVSTAGPIWAILEADRQGTRAGQGSSTNSATPTTFIKRSIRTWKTVLKQITCLNNRLSRLKYAKAFRIERYKVRLRKRPCSKCEDAIVYGFHIPECGP